MTATQPPVQPSELEQAVVHAIEQRSRFGEWPDVLKRAYFARTEERSRLELRYLLLVGMFITVLSIALDAIALPEHLGRSVAMRATLVIGPGLIGLALARRLKLPMLKLTVVCTMIAFAAIVMHLASLADPVTATRFSMGVTIMLVGGILMLPLLREEMVGFAVGFAMATILAGVWPSMVDPKIMLQHIVMVLIVCGAGLAVGIRHLEQRDRMLLYDLRDSFTQAELEQSIRVLRELSDSDSLTGLANRRSFRASFDSKFVDGQRPVGRQVTLLMIDLDRFKDFNDQHGHQAGDRALRVVARALEQCFRDSKGVVARFGGEEFIGALHTSSVAEAEAFGERVRKAIGALNIRLRGRQVVKVTTSIGLASTGPTAAVDMGELTARADRALYRAKSDGRNRVVVSEKIELRVDRLAG